MLTSAVLTSMYNVDMSPCAMLTAAHLPQIETEIVAWQETESASGGASIIQAPMKGPHSHTACTAREHFKACLVIKPRNYFFVLTRNIFIRPTKVAALCWG